MESLKLPGYQISTLVGKGGAAQVYMGYDPAGNQVAIRMLHHMAVNIPLLNRMLTKLGMEDIEGDGPLPVWVDGTDLRPPLLVMPFLADEDEEGNYVPRTLQIKMEEYLGTDKALGLVKKLARAMAAYHAREVPHGNLKPGNVFIDFLGNVRVTDFAQGWMPDLDQHIYTDAALYAAPEHLHDPWGYSYGFGYRLDVYSFCVLAYRLIEGVFPRCHEEFIQLSPNPGKPHLLFQSWDYDLLARMQSKAEIRPFEKCSDPKLKELLTQGLSIAPQERPRDMIELLKTWEGYYENKEIILKSKKNKRSSLIGWSVAVLTFSALIYLLTLFWKNKEETIIVKVPQEEAPIKKEAPVSKPLALFDTKFLLPEVTKTLLPEEKKPTKITSVKKNTSGVDKFNKEMAENQELLMDWVLEGSSQSLPTLENYPYRLYKLEQSYYTLLRKTDTDFPIEWKKRWKNSLAKLALTRSDTKAARQYLENDFNCLDAKGATLFLLKESELDPGKLNIQELKLAREKVEKMRSDHMDRELFLASLLLVEARHISTKETPHKARSKYREAFIVYDGIRKNHPNSLALELWCTKARREASKMANAVGMESLAKALMTKAHEELESPPKEEGEKPLLLKREYILISSTLSEYLYGQGDYKKTSELVEKALGTEMDYQDDNQVLTALATLHAVRAGLQRENGETKKALASLKSGLKLLEQAKLIEPNDKWTQYRIALLNWQYAGALGQNGEKKKERNYAILAKKSLEGLLKTSKDAPPSTYQINHLLGYLCGDLAQASANARKPKDALKYFEEAGSYFSKTLKKNPRSDKLLAAHEWVLSRRNAYKKLLASRRAN